MKINELKEIRFFFAKKSEFYPVLYFNCFILLIPFLNSTIQYKRNENSYKFFVRSFNEPRYDGSNAAVV